MNTNILDRISHGRTDMVFELEATGHPAGATTQDGVPVIRWCARYGDVTAIRFLLNKGESLHSLGENFDLIGAAFHGHWRLCEFLIEAGADVNYADATTGETALHVALCTANRPVYDLVVQVLLSAGADANRATEARAETGSFMRDAFTKGETPLHRAAAFGSEASISRLIRSGADIDAKDMYGESPLAWASWHTRPDNILKLLCYGEFKIHPDRDSSFDHGLGWGYLERDLMGAPRPSGGQPASDLER